EKGTIYGGESNLARGLDNIMRLYSPEIIGVLTTCLAETIGEDVKQICGRYLQDREKADFPLVTVATPGYGGSHSEGYFLALKEIIASLAEPGRKHSKINVIVPNLSPADLREIKRIFDLMQVEYILCPDISETMDMPFVRPYQKIPVGGTHIKDIKSMGNAAATIQMGLTVDEKISPGHYLKKTFDIPLYTLPIPMGIKATDRLLEILSELSGHTIPGSLRQERGRLLDGMIDSHKYNAQGRCVVFGEPELAYAVTSVCLENGLVPALIATGTRSDQLNQLLQEKWQEDPDELCLLQEADFVSIRSAFREKGINLAIGHSDGRFLTEREDIPLVRIGYPIHDRIGGQRILSVGYSGTIQFLDRITNTLLENKQQHYRADMYQRYFA
ncbi:MAG: nitrogenase component 1, partial [Syntrophomonas sp.]